MMCQGENPSSGVGGKAGKVSGSIQAGQIERTANEEIRSYLFSDYKSSYVVHFFGEVVDFEVLERSNK